tara:strand:+ start:1110 stop:1877 length:768 start_codon:yes stop_codon:yes gene_type:complete
MKLDKVDRWFLLQTIILIAMMFGIWNLFQGGHIFGDDAWFKQSCVVENMETGAWGTQYQNTCNPILHPSPFVFVMFTGMIVALGLNIIQTAAQKHPTHFKKRIKLWFEEGLVELKTMPLSDLKILIPISGVMIVLLVGFDVGLSWIKYEECYWEANYVYVNERGGFPNVYNSDTYCIYANSPGIYNVLGFETGALVGFWPSVYGLLGMPTPVTRGQNSFWLSDRILALLILWLVTLALVRALRDLRLLFGRSEVI